MSPVYNRGHGDLFLLTFLRPVLEYREKYIQERTMIHTFTIQHQIQDRDVYRVAGAMSYYEESITEDKIHAFYYWDGDETTKDDCELKAIPNIPGIEEIVLLNQRCYDRSSHTSFSQYWMFIRMEPLNLITGEIHIALFECTKANVERLVTVYRERMSMFLDLDGTDCSINALAEFETWDVNRIDYTIDVRMRNHDEVVAFINLAKMSVLSNKITSAEYTSIYGEHFYDDSFCYGDDTKELQIYDKQYQLRKKQDTEHVYPDSIYKQLLDESDSIARIEYRRLTSGTKKSSTKFESRNIMRFLDESLAQEWLMDCYGSTVGFEDFYLEYHARKRLAAGFPMTGDEKKATAKVDGKENIQLGHKAEAYRQYMINIANHKGRQKALNRLLAENPADNPVSIKRKFVNWSERIRERAQISPVLLPDNWRDRRNMNLPTTYLENPLKNARKLGSATENHQK